MARVRVRWGELALWLGFAWFAIEAAGFQLNYSGADEPVTMAGICLLGAVALRATRTEASP